MFVKQFNSRVGKKKAVLTAICKKSRQVVRVFSQAVLVFLDYKVYVYTANIIFGDNKLQPASRL